MRKLRFLFILLAIVSVTECLSQPSAFKNFSARALAAKDSLYSLDKKAMTGDLQALRRMGSYLDDTSLVWDNLGHHILTSSLRSIALRMIDENSLFTNEELQLDSNLSIKKFLSFFDGNKIVFDELSGSFLITGLEKRTTKYELKMLSAYERQRVDTTVGKSAYPQWYYLSQIDGFILMKNPEALKWIASDWYHHRNRFNNYYFDDKDFLDLIKKLTNAELGVEDEKGNITFLYESDYYNIARLNYLIYWVNHYQDYAWNAEKGYFENKTMTPLSKNTEELLFEQLSSEDDEVALKAFASLTELDPGIIQKLSAEHEKGRDDFNYVLPIFPFRFLPVMAEITQYCRANGIAYKATGWLRDSLDSLTTDLSYPRRYALEDYLISRLRLEDITAVEYFGMLKEKEWDSDYSIGRILDKFYSRVWKDLIGNSAQLELYRKKIPWFDRLGIIGICGKYERKFNPNKIVLPEQAQKRWEGDGTNIETSHLKAKFKQALGGNKDAYDSLYAVQKVFGKIDYQHIGEALQILIADTSIISPEKFSFLEDDFGFDVSYGDLGELRLFLQRYGSMSEKQLYTYYLRNSGLHCFSPSGVLDYPAIYEVLKYDVVDAFAGGGGSRRETGVYMAIKLLEIEFNTTQGYPKKLCSSQGMYSCNCSDRAKTWMRFLEDRGLVKVNAEEAPSIAND